MVRLHTSRLTVFELLLVATSGYGLCTPVARQSPVVLARLLSWCADNGVSGLESLHIDGFASGLGVFSAREIQPGELLLRIPLRLALAGRLVPGFGVAPPAPPWRGAPWQAAIAARLATEMEVQSSLWQPWLDVLPAECQGMKASALSDLQYAPAVRELAALHKDRVALADRTASSLALSDQGDAPASAIVHALTIANTRAFLLELEPTDPWACCHAFVPLLDLFNHAPITESHVEWALDDAARTLEVRATRPAAAGTHLTLCYDPTATNDDYVVYHGFCPACNPADDVELFDSVEAAVEWHRATYPSQPDAELAATAVALAAMPPLDGSLYTRRVGVASGGPKGQPLWIQAAQVDPRLLVRPSATPRVTPPTSPLTRMPSHLTRMPSHFTRMPSHTPRHTSHGCPPLCSHAISAMSHSQRPFRPCTRRTLLGMSHGGVLARGRRRFGSSPPSARWMAAAPSPIPTRQRWRPVPSWPGVKSCSPPSPQRSRRIWGRWPIAASRSGR